MGISKLTMEQIKALVPNKDFVKEMLTEMHRKTQAASAEALAEIKKEMEENHEEVEEGTPMGVDPIQGTIMDLHGLYGDIAGDDQISLVFSNSTLVRAGIILRSQQDYVDSTKDETFKFRMAKFVSDMLTTFRDCGMSLHDNLHDSKCAVMWHGDTHGIAEYRMECIRDALIVSGLPTEVQDLIIESMTDANLKSMHYSIEQVQELRFHPLALAYIEAAIRHQEEHGFKRDQDLNLSISVEQFYGSGSRFGKSGIHTTIKEEKVKAIWINPDPDVNVIDPADSAGKLLEYSSVVAMHLAEVLRYWGYDTTEYEVYYSPTPVDLKRHDFKKFFSMEYAMKLMKLARDEAANALKTKDLPEEVMGQVQEAYDRVTRGAGSSYPASKVLH